MRIQCVRINFENFSKMDGTGEIFFQCNDWWENPLYLVKLPNLQKHFNCSAKNFIKKDLLYTACTLRENSISLA